MFKMATLPRQYFRSGINRYLALRFYSQVTAKLSKKGLVVGVYTKEEKDKLILSTAAERFNKKTGGRFVEQLNKVGCGLKKGATRVLYCLDDEYLAVSVVGLDRRCQGYDELEELDEDREAARQASAAGTKALQGMGLSEIAVEDFGDAEAAAEGANLAVWTYQDLKAEKDRKTTPEIISYCPTDIDLWLAGCTKAKAQNIARKLMETPANLLTPMLFAETAASLLGSFNNVKVVARDRSWAEKEKMGAFLSVAQGSSQPPVFLEITYTGNEKETQPIIFVGKGVTFDSGGISIKPSTGMEDMRGDMGGAACVLASIYAAASLRLPVYVKGLIPLCENMPSSTATKPGDVVVAKNGKTIKIDNTDAEGRLILADALCYAEQFNPKFILDIATLTGAMSIALGGGATGVFTNSTKLWREIQAAGTYTGDRMWRFPLWQLYTKRMTDFSSVDINNVGKGKGGGACTAAAFLKEFVKSCDWIHLDMASVMCQTGDMPYLCEGMSGRPTRTLVQFLKQSS